MGRSPVTLTAAAGRVAPRPGRSPIGPERATFLVAGGALHADDRPLVELRDRPGAGVGAGGTNAGHDVVEDVLHARAVRVEVHPRARDALLEQLLTGPFERRLVARAVLDRTV